MLLLAKLGSNLFFDTNFGADLTIVEEAAELLGRIKNGGTLPMFTSCCPGWINFVERHVPQIIPYLSTARSPHMMLGSIIKSYFAEKKKYRKEKIYTVSLMPCIAKKDEIQRPQFAGDIDAVLTVREFARLIKTYEIDWKNLKDSGFDTLLSESTSAATIFGVTGGVMEAALRYAYEQITHEKLGQVAFTQLRGFESIRTADLMLGEIQIKVAVCSGIAAAKKFIESGKYKEFTFVEVMACPSGCIAGAGQPKVKGKDEAEKRAASIFRIANAIKKPTTNDNSEVQKLYSEYLGEPNGEKAHQLLHTHYSAFT